MSKITLNDLSNLQNEDTAVSLINTNSSTLQTAFDNTLSRDGTMPNQMMANIDMNSNQIINLPSPGSATSPVRLQDVTTSPIISSVPPTGTSGAVVPFLNGTNTWSGAQTFNASAILNKGYSNNTTSVTGSGALAKFYNPTYFGAGGTGIVDRLNRVFVGGAVASSSDLLTGPPILPTTTSWLDTLSQEPWVGEAQLAVLHTWGGPSIVGASRSSDYRAVLGSSSGGSTGVLAIGVNDDTSGSPIATGINAIILHRAGCTGVSTNQFDCNSVNTVVDVTPFGGVVGGSTFANGLTPGAYGSLATNNISAAQWIGVGATTKFRKGIIFFNGSLDTAVGGGTNGVAIEMARNMSVRWLNNSPTTDAEMWANASGLHLTGALTSSSFLTTTGGGVGYSPGAGGTVTQLTSKSTGVTLNKTTGQIVTFNTAMTAGTEAVFTVTNNTVGATDVIIVNMASGGTSGSYLFSVTAVAVGSFDITISNCSAGTLTEALTLNFAIIKGVTT